MMYSRTSAVSMVVEVELPPTSDIRLPIAGACSRPRIEKLEVDT